MITFIDSHCHLDYKDTADTHQVIERAKTAGIRAFVNICTGLAEAHQIINTAEQFENVFATVGIHPHDAEETLRQKSEDELAAWLADLAAHPKVIALGETGLDFFYDNSPREQQQSAFKAHIQAAKATGLPLVVHTRAASEQTIEALRGAAGTIQGVMHCFSETQWLADQALELGFYISISGIITFKKAQELRDVVKTVPLERLLLETDAPFLAPVPYRGQQNEPAFMIETAKVLAELKGVSLAEIAAITTANFKALFSKAVPLLK
jgi:TatD DNase family protein